MSTNGSRDFTDAAPEMIRAARIFFFAEQLGGVFYRRFAEQVSNDDVGQALHGFGSDEYRHADWYLAWLHEHGAEAPRLERVSARAAPLLTRLMRAKSLEEQLRMFSRGESVAAAHLCRIAVKIRDPSLRAIVERTIPAEEGHAAWFPQLGRRMLHPSDRAGRSIFDLLRATPIARR